MIEKLRLFYALYEWASTHYMEITAGLLLALLGARQLFRAIPGEEPDRTIDKIIRKIRGYVKKPLASSDMEKQLREIEKEPVDDSKSAH